MMNTGKNAVAYLRVSTSSQGKSGNGLAAQRTAIERFAQAEGFTVSAWFEEVETGKGSDAMERRPKLAEALRLAKRIKGPVIASHLDRLSRDVAFISRLMAEKVFFLTAETGMTAEPLYLHIRAAMAEDERKKISMRTKAALATLKAKGVKLGNPSRRSLKAASQKSVAVRQAHARVFAEGTLSMVRGYQAGGLSLRKIAAELNTRGVPTYRGNGTWTAKQLWRMQQIVVTS
jgi:DNA invertase Pin-like site-specific DNA recombinase